MVHNDVQQQQQQQQQRSNGDGTLSPTSNQLARWFSPELLAQGMNKFFQSNIQINRILVARQNKNKIYISFNFF